MDLEPSEPLLEAFPAEDDDDEEEEDEVIEEDMVCLTHLRGESWSCDLFRRSRR